MGSLAERLREFRSVMLQDEGWAAHLSPPPIKDRLIPERGKAAAHLPTDFQRQILRQFGPLDEISIREVGYRLGMAPDRIHTDVSRLVRVGWLYSEPVPGQAVAKLYGITDEGEEVARGPTKTEARGRALQDIYLSDSPHKLHAGLAKPVDIRHADWDDWVHTGARWVTQADFEAMSGPCVVVQDGHRTPFAVHPRTPAGSTHKQHEVIMEPRSGEIVQLYQAGWSQMAIKQKFRISSRRLLRILHAEGVTVRSSGEQSKITNLRRGGAQ